MAYSAPSTISTGDLITAAKWNADVSANPIAIYAGAMSVTSQAVGDILYASSTTQLGRVGIGSANKVLTSSGSAPQWSTQLVNAALPTNIDVGGTLDVTGQTTLDSTLGVVGDVVFNDAGADKDFRVESDDNANMLFVDGGADRVGIGTSSPDALLQLESATDGAATLEVRCTVTPNGSKYGGHLNLGLHQNNNSGSGANETQAGDILGQISFKGQGYDYDYQGGRIACVVQTGPSNGTRTQQGTYLSFSTINTSSASYAEVMRIDQDGKLGIGTTSPDSQLHVVGTVNVRSSSSQSFNDSANASNLKMNDGGATFNEDSADKDFRIESDGNAFAFFLEGSSGNIGIGGASDAYAAVTLRSAFTSDGSSSVARGFDTDRMTVTAVSGDTTHVLGSLFSAAMTVPDVSETFADVAQVMIDEPAITKGAAATITNSSSLKITGAASEATNNYALWVDAGVSRFDGPMIGAGGHVNEGRLTLTSGTAVTTADVTGAGTVYFALDKGDKIALYDGSSAWVTVVFAEMSISLSGGTASKPNDIFLDYNGGSPALAILAWTNDTTRATALVKQNGVWVKNGDTQQRYLGTVWLDGSSQCADSNAKRHCWNLENQRVRPLKRIDSTDSWTYQTASYRQANGSSANQVDVVIGVAQSVLVILNAVSQSSGTGRWRMNAIGLDGTSANGITGRCTGTAGEGETTTSVYNEITAVGRHYLVWLEMSSAGDTTTWYGDNGGTVQYSGMAGSVMG